MNTQFHNASHQRGNRRSFDPKAFTRAQATQIIASTTDTNLIQKFADHSNKHVRRYVFHKLGGTVEVRGIFSNLEKLFSLGAHELRETYSGPIVPETEIAELAQKYGEDPGVVTQLYSSLADGPTDDPAEEQRLTLAALKRSLISRKSARTRAAKKNGG